jgi:CBS domain-containing protein
MNVHEICQKNVVTVRQTEGLIAAVQLMREKHIGYLVVIESEAQVQHPVPIGVLTDRDVVVSVMARTADARELTVGDVMTRKPVVVRDTDSIKVALQEMRRIGVRRLPVVNDDGRLTGVLSLDDLLDSFAGQLTEVAQAIRRGQDVEFALRP